jgi:hypothetical protein
MADSVGLDMLGNFSSAISGALAYAFDGVSGKGGLSGWQWLFLVEGLFTICYGILLYFVLPDCEYQQTLPKQKLTNLVVPDTAKWLSSKEKAFVQAR